MYRRPLDRLPLLAGLLLVLSACSTPSQSRTGRTSDAGTGIGLTQLATAPQVRRVWVEPVTSNDFGELADGHSVAYFDLTTSQMRVRDLRTGAERKVVTHVATDQDDGSYAEHIVGSPDGECLAYGWFGAAAQLRVSCEAASDSGSVRVIEAVDTMASLVPLSWTPDGKEIVGFRHIRARDTDDPERMTLEAIRSDGGGSRVIHSLHGAVWVPRAVVSPDGKWLAYDAATYVGNRHVHIVAMDGTGGRVVTEVSGVHTVAGWAGEDGGQLLVLSTSSGGTALWSIPVTRGQRAGQPVLVRSNLWGAWQARMSSGGDVWYRVRAGHLALYSSTVDSEQQSFGNGEQLIAQNKAKMFHTASAWSPVAREVAYVVREGQSDSAASRVHVTVRSLSPAAERRIPTPLVAITRLQWFPDGHSLLMIGTEDRKSAIAYRMMVATGAITRLSELDSIAWPMIATVVSPAEERIFFPTRSDSRYALKEVDLTTGIVRIVREFSDDEQLAGTAASRDGNSVALALRYDRPISSRLVTITDDGTEREVVRLAPGEYFHYSTPPFFTPDGEALIFGTYRLDAQSTFVIYRVTLANGRVTPTELRGSGLQFVALSPDGRDVSYAIDGRAYELWRMDRPIFPDVTGDP